MKFFPGLKKATLVRNIIENHQKSGKTQKILSAESCFGLCDLNHLFLIITTMDILLQVVNETTFPVVSAEDGLPSYPVAMETGYFTEFQSMVQVRKQVFS